MELSNQQILDSLLAERDKLISSGKFMQKNFTTKDGDTIFMRSPEDLENYIEFYRAKVAREQKSGGRLYRIKLYV